MANYRNNILLILLAVIASSSFCACSDKDEEADNPLPINLEEGVVSVTISLSIGSGWTVGIGEGERSANQRRGTTRSEAYDAEELEGVREAAIYVFRRKIGSCEEEPFRYDPTNYMVISLTGNSSSDSATGLQGTGTLLKRPGFEYRVIAIAYSTVRQSSYHNIDLNTASTCELKNVTNDLQRFFIPVEPEMHLEDFSVIIKRYEVKYEANNWFDYYDGSGGTNDVPITNLKEEYYHTNVLSGFITEFPQLFYCDCYTNYQGTVKEVIPYSESTNNGGEDESDNSEIIYDIPIAGELKGAMSKIEINIANVTPPSTAPYGLGTPAALKWITLMSDNLKDSNTFSELRRDNYEETLDEIGKYTSFCYSENIEEKNLPMSLTAYIWPSLTHLAVRLNCKTKYGNNTGNFLENYQLWPEDEVTKDEDTGEEIRHTFNNVFYLRPNHKYVINVNDSKDLFKHPIK